MESLDLASRSLGGEPKPVLLTHEGDSAAIKENTWWMGMLLVPWANRIAYVS